jgi:hypothetical protein
MVSCYQFITCVVVVLSLFSGLAYAASSTGSKPGFSSLPTSFEWEGDRVLNGVDVSTLFDEIKTEMPDDLSGAGMVLYPAGGTGNGITNATNVTDAFNLTDTPGSTNITGTSIADSAVNNTTSPGADPGDPRSGYTSVGDIIRAQDWTALQRYTSGIKANSEIPDSLLSFGNQNNKWDSYFKDPQPVSCGPC